MWIDWSNCCIALKQANHAGQFSNENDTSWIVNVRAVGENMVWWMEVGWVGSPPHIIAHTMCTRLLKRHHSVFSFVFARARCLQFEAMASNGVKNYVFSAQYSTKRKSGQISISR